MPAIRWVSGGAGGGGECIEVADDAGVGGGRKWAIGRGKVC